ncbi:hypothetical protein ACJJTC_017812 [Scirpophaga incertulas]
MKLLVLFLVVAVVQAKLESDSGTIKAPAPYSIIALENPDAFTLIWIPPPSPPLNPVIGFKVSMWAQKTITAIESVEIDGEIVQIETEKLVPFTGELPDWKPQSEQIVSTLHNSATFYDIKRGITYEIRVQAFSPNETGPFSSPVSSMIAER